MKRLGEKDRRVIEAFLQHCPRHDGYKLDTDGCDLDGLWMGGRRIATWAGGRIEIPYPGGRSAQFVGRQVRRLALRLVREDIFALSKEEQRTRTRYATAPHGQCAAKGRCIEPVPDEEKCR